MAALIAIAVLFVYIFAAWKTAEAAERRNRPFLAWFLISLAVLPLAVLIVAAMPRPPLRQP